MAKVEFVGQSARDLTHRAANSSRLVNFYREPVLVGGVTTNILRSVLGTTAYADLDGVFMRDMAVVDGVIYAVCGARLFSVNATTLNLGAVADGDATISGNFGKVAVTAGGTYRVWDGTMLSTPTPGAFSSFGSGTYVGGYTVLTERNGRRFQWSALADPTSLPGLNFATAEARDFNLIRAAELGGQLVLFSGGSIEFWYQTGGSGAAAFERAAGAVNDVGLLSHGLLARAPNALFFVGTDGMAYVMAGQQPQPVSTPPVASAIKSKNPLRCFYYEDEDHKFLCIAFRDAPAWCLDLATMEWHERAEGRLLEPWTVRATAKLGQQWYAGADDGIVRQLTRNNADVGAPLIRQATSRTLETGDRFRVKELEFAGRRGWTTDTVLLNQVIGFNPPPVAVVDSDIAGLFTGLVTAQGEPLIIIDMSDDFGHNWQSQRIRGMGALGEFAKRIVVKSAGQYRQFTVRITMSAPADIVMDADARVAIA